MPGACPDPSGHSSDSAGCIVDRFSLVCEGGECRREIYLDMYHVSAVPQAPPEGLLLTKDAPTITLHYEAGQPAWRISVVQPSRFREVDYELKIRLFLMRQGALFGVLLNLFDVPEQPYFVHRVMDLSDPKILAYLDACVRTGLLVAVFEPKGEDEGFRRELRLDAALWEKELRAGQAHNRRLRTDGDKALAAFLDVFNPASMTKGVESAWDEVGLKFDLAR
jgi:hypothetical protein